MSPFYVLLPFSTLIQMVLCCPTKKKKKHPEGLISLLDRKNLPSKRRFSHKKQIFLSQFIKASVLNPFSECDSVFCKHEEIPTYNSVRNFIILLYLNCYIMCSLQASLRWLFLSIFKQHKNKEIPPFTQ